MVCLLCVGIAVVVGYFVLRYLWELIPVGGLSEKAVFISGCDTGFGRSLALKCARAGMTVFAGCLTDEGAKDLEKEAGALPLKTVPLDVTSDDSVAKARKFVDENIGTKKLWAVVNNAGIFSCYGPADWCTIDEYKLSFEVNTLGVIRCTRAFMDLIKASKGRVIAVSSVSGRISAPGAAPYSVAKYGVEAYMDTVRREVSEWGVRCSILEPGAFKSTNLLDKVAMEKRVDSVWAKMSEDMKEEYGEEFKLEFLELWNKILDQVGSSKIEYVVDSYFHAITALYPRMRYQCGWDSILMWIPTTYLPTPAQDIILWAIAGEKILPRCFTKQLNKSQ